MNNSKETKKLPITSDGALFRSVSMSVAPPPPALFVRHNDETQKPSNMSPGSSKVHKSKSSPASMRHHDASWTWTLEDGQLLLPVPMYYPLERSSVKVTDLAAATVMARISSFMKAQSIQAQYSKDKIGRVDGRTDQLVNFTLQLWQSPDKEIIVEVQRRQGCCIQMQALRHGIMQAILRGESHTPAPPSRSSCDFVNKWVQKQVPSSSSSLCSGSALRMCESWLAGSQVDQHRLALESLCALTNPSKVVDARKCAHFLWTQPQWLGLLEQYLCPSADNRNASSDMELLALKVLTQTLELIVLEKNPNLGHSSSPDYWNSLQDHLQKHISIASSEPLLAALSMRTILCLQSLQLLPKQLLHLQKGVRNARIYGQQHHQGLEQESERLIRRLVCEPSL